jgi:hypothetical protein
MTLRAKATDEAAKWFNAMNVSQHYLMHSHALL